MSCTNRNNIPSNIIKPDKMKSVFWDMIRADILAEEIANRDSSKKVEAEKAVFAEQVFSIHKIAKSDFENSLAFYENHPDLLRIILDSLNANQATKNYNEVKMQNFKRKLQK